LEHHDLTTDLRLVRAGLQTAGIPVALLNAISTRALRTGRRQTGQFPTNRQSRWQLDPQHPQYGTEEDCKEILLGLLATLLEFQGAPAVSEETMQILERHLRRELSPNSYRDPLTLELLDYHAFLAEVESPVHGRSEFHIGHRDPRAVPKHVPTNVEWRTARSNLIQGDLTLREARSKFVELIARYFKLGEVTITPEEGGEQ
jgi:hypothetical protein